MADNFGLKIGVEGEKEFKRALSDINQSFKVLGSEMKLVESEFGKNENSVQSLTSKNEVLTKQIDAQKDKIETLRKALENASSSFGENDRRTQRWGQDQLPVLGQWLHERRHDRFAELFDRLASGRDGNDGREEMGYRPQRRRDFRARQHRERRSRSPFL